MSLLLCRQEQVTHPYYVEYLGIHIYSSQELCYVLYHHPMLGMEGFLNDGLLDFLRNELDMGFTALKLERWQKNGENGDEALAVLLQECDYYSASEINLYRQKLSALRKLSSLEYAKRKADFLFQMKQYGRAITVYREIIEGALSSRAEERFLGKVWYNLGSSYARVFRFEKAYDALDQAYLLLKEIDVLQSIYHLTRLGPGLVLKERYQSMLTPKLKAEWDQTYEEAQKRAENSPELSKLGELFARDSIRRMDGASQMIQEWKKEYRNMV